MVQKIFPYIEPFRRDTSVTHRQIASFTAYAALSALHGQKIDQHEVIIMIILESFYINMLFLMLF